jgi:hypothetical protein
VLRVVQKNKEHKKIIIDAAFFVHRYSNTTDGRKELLNAPAPAAVRAVEAASQHSLAPLSSLAPTDRVDSDSLCIISSFLCGCDFLRIIRVCRRWSGLRLRPVAWPSPQPCDAHSDDHVAAFYDLFEQRGVMFNVACLALRSSTAGGVRRLLERGVLDSLMPRLETDRPSDAMLSLLLHISRTDDGAHVGVLVSRGIIGKLGELIDRLGEDAVRRRACGVLAAVLYGSTAVEVDVAVQDGLIPVLVARSACDSFNDHFAVQALTYICLRGTDAHRRALLAANFLPLLLEEARHMAGSSDHDARRTELQVRKEVGFALDLLSALSLLLRTASPMDAEAAVVASSSPKAAHVLRAELAALGEHWHPAVRAQVAELLRDINLV